MDLKTSDVLTSMIHDSVTLVTDMVGGDFAEREERGREREGVKKLGAWEIERESEVRPQSFIKGRVQ